MNVLIMSPHFPENFYLFCKALHRSGATVLAIANVDYYELRSELREVLTEYYKVQDMHNYDELIRAVGYFTYRHGKIDRIESHNEQWLEADARLRMDFNVFGIHPQQLEYTQYKSKMKEKFQAAGIPVVRGKVVHSPKDAMDLVQEVGYPVIAKPDKRVEAFNTTLIHHAGELYRFFEEKETTDYMLEEFIRGQLYSFDGLTDRHGNIVFSTSHVFNHSDMEIFNHDLNMAYYSLREIPEALNDYGAKIIDAFGMKERFFHLEFFKVDERRFIILEANMRPPAGLTMDMFNYAADVDLYQEWANLIVYDTFRAMAYQRKYHVGYIGRKPNRRYQHSHDDILRTYGDLIVHYQEMRGMLVSVLGNSGYVVRSPELTRMFEVIEFIHQTEE
ncbi:phosphoribosylglycinamide synthetase, ATP-grasp (A) domain [Candidatus Vecturithrix granuli]|uniref:Phosphoribosylglycinamide synthetase, ATP-grasp (A) domain n=1 Tax=Vecturithrix granuli TaxID=1499967 RepID=A0A081C777_VECG1|nr:phosphoribosylglycinamide synthetase, ATP-grasp (A) domain [Candidatus Vecturithrix granuli]